MNAVPEIEENIRSTEAEIRTMDAQRAEVAERACTEIAEVDALLAPLDAEVRKGLSEGSRRAEEVRTQRRALHARRHAAETSLTLWDRDHGHILSGLKERVITLRTNLEQAEFAARTAADLERAEKDARFRLKAAQGDLTAARDVLAHYRTKLEQAHEAAEAEEDAVAAHAELIGEREALQADAFVSDKPVDPAKVAELDRRIAAAEGTIEQLRRQAEGARAAVGTLEGRISEQERMVDQALERVKAAEGAVLAAVRTRAVREIADLVDALQAPMLRLEAADPTTGQHFVKAMTERGLHTIRVDGRIVRPDWLHSVTYRPEGFADELRAMRESLLPTSEEL